MLGKGVGVQRTPVVSDMFPSAFFAERVILLRFFSDFTEFFGKVPKFPRGIARQGIYGQILSFARWYGNLGIIRERENFLKIFELILRF